MTIGLTIPGVSTVHPVEEWVEPCFPMLGPTQNVGAIYQPVAHYSSAINLPDGDIGEFDYQIIPFLRATNRDYWLNRDGSGIRACGRDLPGYAIGYLFGVDWLGGAWELRGFNYQSAANAGHNGYTFPILFFTDRVDPASELAWQTARAIWRHARALSRRDDFRNRPLGHGELRERTGVGTVTPCPGTPILNQLHAGLGDLDFEEQHMITPFKEPVRAYDSRPGEQAAVDDALAEANLGLGTPLGPLAAGQSRRVFVGLAQNAYVIVHGIGRSGDGFVRVGGSPKVPGTSLVNFDAGKIEDCGMMVGLTDGSVWVTAGPTECDFIVEVSARW